MRVLSWNVAGRLRLLADQVAAIGDRNPDVVALQEVTASSRRRFREALPGIGLAHVIDSFELAPDHSLLKGPRRYGQLVASRSPLRPLSPDAFDVPWPERVLSAVLDSPAGEIELHVVHIPPGASNGWTKVEMFEGIYGRLSQPSDRPRILCGDFNSPREEGADGSVETWGRKPGRGERWDRAERNVLTGLRDFDLPDTYRDVHGCGKQEFSHYSRGRGRRYDHVFASASLRREGVRYLHDLRERGLSDHSPIEIDLGEPTSTGLA